MSFRYMRLVLFFDLPTLSSLNLKSYRNFVKGIKEEGFYMLQESVYIKMVLNKKYADSTIKRIKKNLPSEGSVLVLTITEKQFSSMNILLGKNKSDVINDIDRVVVL